MLNLGMEGGGGGCGVADNCSWLIISQKAVLKLGDGLKWVPHLFDFVRTCVSVSVYMKELIHGH